MLKRILQPVIRSAYGMVTPLRRAPPEVSGRASGPSRSLLWRLVRTGASVEDGASCLRQLLPPDVPVTERSIHDAMAELGSSEALRSRLAEHEHIVGKHLQHRLREPITWDVLLWFVAPRLLRPECVVETGCATGWTSSLLLLALSLNDKGQLHTIDIPPVKGRFDMNFTLPEHLSSGFLVPESLKTRWSLTLGDTREHLAPLLRSLGQIDLFYHDSDHSFVHMMCEYTTVWPHLREGGILLSDDIGCNTAF